MNFAHRLLVVAATLHLGVLACLATGGIALADDQVIRPLNGHGGVGIPTCSGCRLDYELLHEKGEFLEWCGLNFFPLMDALYGRKCQHYVCNDGKYSWKASAWTFKLCFLNTFEDAPCPDAKTCSPTSGD